MGLNVLSNGDKGNDVLTFQEKLNELGYGELAEDAIFGPNTEQAVRDYQRDNDLKVDGIIGPNTSTSMLSQMNPDHDENRNDSTSQSDNTIGDNDNIPDKEPKNDSFDNSYDSQFNIASDSPSHEELIGSAGILRGTNKSKEYLYHKINSYNKVIQDIQSGYEFSYVFITRPELNLFRNGNNNRLSKSLFTEAQPNLTDSADLRYLVEDNMELARFLDATVPPIDGKNPKFIYPMMNLLKEMSSTDVEFSVKSSPANKQGISIDYPTNYIESMAGVPISLTFNTDKYDTILRLIHIWTMYMTLVQKGYVRPRMETIAKNKFESSVAIYQFVTSEDGETLKYWSKGIGAYPQGVPYSDKSHKRKRKIGDQDITVPFYVPFFISMRPSILAGFNQLMNYETQSGSKPLPWNGLPISERSIEHYFSDKAVIVKEDSNFKLRFFNDKGLGNQNNNTDKSINNQSIQPNNSETYSTQYSFNQDEFDEATNDTSIEELF